MKTSRLGLLILLCLAFCTFIFWGGNTVIGQSTDSDLQLASDSISNEVVKTRVYVFEIKEEIAKPVWRKVQKAFTEAKSIDADLILIHMNTYGGQVDIADSIRTKILQSEIPVYVFIDNNAASAGALISIACDSIYMRPGANFGAATVVNQSAEQMPDKYQSYMRSMMRSTAETNGRNPSIAEAMVDPDVEVEGISAIGKVLTFTTEEAILNNFCEGKAESIAEVVDKQHFESVELHHQVLTPLDKIISLLISPIVSGLLIVLIIGGIYFELQTPGLGFPSIAAIVAAVIYFAPLYLEGLAANWEIIVFIVGVILMMLEIFAIPGFGVAGISGIILMVLGLSFSMVDNVGFSLAEGQGEILFTSFFIVIISSTLGIILSFILAKQVLTSENWNLALNTVMKQDEGFSSGDMSYKSLIGEDALAKTVLRPGGKIEINGEVYDAVSETSFIAKDSEVIITRYENAQLFVRKK